MRRTVEKRLDVWKGESGWVGIRWRAAACQGAGAMRVAGSGRITVSLVEAEGRVDMAAADLSRGRIIYRFK